MGFCRDCKFYKHMPVPAQLDGEDVHLCVNPTYTLLDHVRGEYNLRDCYVLNNIGQCQEYEESPRK